MARQRKQRKARNWLAFHAINRSGAGAHTPSRKRRRRAAQSEIDEVLEEYYEWDDVLDEVYG